MITALYVRSNSIYSQLGIDCYDEERNALTYPGASPVICHPPCRLWSRLHCFSTAPVQEKLLAAHAVTMVRKYGGILEHPSGSHLFNLIQWLPGENRDNYGGYLISINQHWFGHKAQKKTLLYIVGIPLKDLPQIPLNFNAVQFKISGSRSNIKETSKVEREETPVALAKWLIETAKRISFLKTKFSSL